MKLDAASPGPLPRQQNQGWATPCVSELGQDAPRPHTIHIPRSELKYSGPSYSPPLPTLTPSIRIKLPQGTWTVNRTGLLPHSHCHASGLGLLCPNPRCDCSVRPPGPSRSGPPCSTLPHDHLTHPDWNWDQAVFLPHHMSRSGLLYFASIPGGWIKARL